MANFLEYRMSKLLQRSDHYRRLAEGVLPSVVNAAILEVAEEYDNEVARMERDCRSRRCCPCALFVGRCRPLD